MRSLLFIAVSPILAMAQAAPGPTVFEVASVKPTQTLGDVFRQLGIVMQPQHAVVDMFYIEHVERPAAN